MELIIFVIVWINFGVRCLLPLEKFVQIVTATKVSFKSESHLIFKSQSYMYVNGEYNAVVSTVCVVCAVLMQFIKFKTSCIRNSQLMLLHFSVLPGTSCCFTASHHHCILIRQCVHFTSVVTVSGFCNLVCGCGFSELPPRRQW